MRLSIQGNCAPRKQRRDEAERLKPVGYRMKAAVQAAVQAYRRLQPVECRLKSKRLSTLKRMRLPCRIIR